MYIDRSKIDSRAKKNKLRIILLIMVLLCAVTFIIIFKTDLLSVQGIEIYGNENLTKEEIMPSVESTMGFNIFKVKLDSIASSVLANPYIKTVSVKRKLPNKLIVRISERKEAAVVPFMGTFLIIDEEGVVLKSALQTPGLKSINGLEFSNFMEGSVLHVSDQEQLEKALSLAKAMKYIDEDIKEINVTNKKNMVIRFSKGLSCKIGEGENLDYKLQLLKGILADLDSKGITRGVIDISHEGNPSYSPVE
ncbi:cell division protein FtsQ [Anaerosolibacter carboniphilus]|uniref:Cell division protein FtsQ n=1 Tax=Anaerosolibacter carboniphilus TaxID=1417629 RepID=A0A841KUF9_9FIRM|nr:FtsQ-type POTRA domain-containing protein [Anaerosolibacter carboniphilus]MBB6217003.1 cell division protein FtsQ [Anaerosolibacter carboniphilus]